jgi:hypothetical protein
MFALQVTPCIGSGICLLVSALLNICAQINQTSDEAAGQTAGANDLKSSFTGV